MTRWDVAITVGLLVVAVTVGSVVRVAVDQHRHRADPDREWCPAPDGHRILLRGRDAFAPSTGCQVITVMLDLDRPQR